MKRITILLSIIVIAGRALAGGSVMVNETTGVIQYPTNLIAANSIATTNQNTAVSNRVTTLEGQTNGWATTNQYVSVSNRVTSLESITNASATTNQYVAVSNRTTVLEAGVLWKTNVFVGDVTGVWSNMTVSNKFVWVTNATLGDIAWYNGTNWARLAAGTAGQSLTTDGTYPSWSNVTASAANFTNTIGSTAYTNVGFNLQPGSNATQRLSGTTNYLDFTPLLRYQAGYVANYEIQVFATGAGVTSSIVGSSITMTIPSGVRLVSMRVRWDGTASTGFTLNMGTTDMPNSSLANRWGATFWACREDTGAFLPTATCKLDSANHDQLIVAGLSDVSVNHCMFSF